MNLIVKRGLQKKVPTSKYQYFDRILDIGRTDYSYDQRNPKGVQIEPFAIEKTDTVLPWRIVNLFSDVFYAKCFTLEWNKHLIKSL